MSAINEKYKEIALNEFQNKYSFILENELKEKEDYKKLLEDTKELYIQLNFSRTINLITNIEFQNYMFKLEKQIIEKLKKERFKIFKERIVNFNDDIITPLERLYKARQDEKKYNEWKDKIDARRSEKEKLAGEKIKTSDKKIGEKEIEKDVIERY